MSEGTHERSMPAPRQEWLTRKELARELDVEERTIAKLIREGKFPHGTKWDGKELRWRWWVVWWFRLQKDVEPLIYPSTGKEEEGDEEDEAEESPKPPKR